MVRTPSTMVDLATKAPTFLLPDPSGKMHALDDRPDAKAYLVMFICNHCPFVIHLKDALAQFGRDYANRGLAIYAINSNDVANYPADAPDKMAEMARDTGFNFPYLFDETQEVAKAYKAACTPDFFLYDGSQSLVYRGQFDDSRPGNGKPIDGKDLRNAADAVLNDAPVSPDQKHSIGCNIKWKPGQEPNYF